MHNFVPSAQDKAGQWLKLVYPVKQLQIGMEHDGTPPEKISARQLQPADKLIHKYHIEIAICKKEVAGKLWPETGSTNLVLVYILLMPCLNILLTYCNDTIRMRLKASLEGL